MRRLIRWLYRKAIRRPTYAPMIEGQLFTRLMLANESITDEPRSAMQ